MKPGKSLAVGLLIATVAYAAESSKIQLPPLGFQTIDFSREFWVSLKDDYKLKGKVVDTLSYDQIKRLVVIRCNMHVPAGDYLDRFIRRWFADSATFSSGPIPEDNARDLRNPLLTVLVENQKDRLGLLTIYSDVAFLEVDSGYGLITKSQSP